MSFLCYFRNSRLNRLIVKINYLCIMVKENLRSVSLIKDILQEKCPHCHNGHVFKKNVGVFKMPEMNETCSECGYKFEREPGYFLGAMYISYGIAVFMGLLTFLLCYLLFPEMPTVFFPIAIVLVITAIARKNFKLSRVIYIHLFPW